MEETRKRDHSFVQLPGKAVENDTKSMDSR